MRNLAKYTKYHAMIVNLATLDRLNETNLKTRILEHQSAI